MNETISLSPRQKEIINIIAHSEGITREDIAVKLSNALSASKATLARDLKSLIDLNLIQAVGSGPSTAYKSVSKHPLLVYIDLERYFSVEADERTFANKKFDNKIFKSLPGIIFDAEQNKIENNFRSFDQATKNLDPTIFQRELERYVIELSWKSSKIEGNTYTLLETESLIKQGKEARGKSKQESIMILNHKEAFGLILEHRKDFSKITNRDLLELHNVLTKDLNISGGIRKQAVGITGTTYKPLAHDWELQKALEEMINLVNKAKFPLEKALIVSILLAYIQPFADGNKRSARMLANAILLAHDYFPLSYRSINEDEYKQAMIVFYETSNIYHIKRLFLEQYHFAVKTYFQASI
ncbi:Fic family protein [Patescibacteria group bacterium]|nr:Fic family protein [Patescibacteria group bacterium]